MLDEQQLKKLYLTVSKIDEKIKLKDIYKLLTELGLKSYPPTVIILIKKILTDKQEDQIEEMQEVLTFQQFKLLTEILSNPFQKSLFQFGKEVNYTINQIIEEISSRDMTVRDRELQSKFKIRVGPEQKYKQEMKIEILKNAQKKIITPWLSIQFDVKEQNKNLVQKTIVQIFNKLIQFFISQNVKSEESIKKITIQTTQTEKGVRAVIEIRSQRFNEIQEIISVFFDRILKTTVNGKFMFSLKFNKSVRELVDLSRIQHIFTIISKDCEIVLECTLSKIMSGIKQIICTVPTFLDLQYNKFDIPSILAILFSNIEDMDAEVQFQNTEYTSEELENQIFNQLNQMRIQTISQLKESGQELLEAFGFAPLFKFIDDSISVQCSFGTFDFSFFFKFENLSAIFNELFSGAGDQNGNGNADRNSNQSSQPMDRQVSNSSDG